MLFRDSYSIKIHIFIDAILNLDRFLKLSLTSFVIVEKIE